MGAGALTKPKFDGKEAYQVWTADNVADAFARYRELGFGGVPPSDISKNDWFQLFNDYTVMLEGGGGFLTLPLDGFKLLDRRGTQRVHVGLPFMLLCLLSEGALEDRMRIIFDVFDFNLNGTLDRASASEMMKILVTVLKVIGVVPDTAPPPGADDAAADAVRSTPMSPRFHGDDLLQVFFEDAEEITPDQFVAAWTNKGAHILSAIKRLSEETDEDDAAAAGANAKKGGAGGAKKAGAAAGQKKPRKQGKPLDPTKSAARHERARDRFGAEAAKAKQGAEVKKTVEAHLEETHLEMSYFERNNEFKKHHGKVNAVASQKVMVELISKTGLDYKDLSELRVEFSEAMNRKSVDGYAGMSIGRLKSVLLAKFANLSDGKLLDRIVGVFDLDHDDKVNYEEFAIAIAKLCHGGTEGQLDFLFSMYDKDGSGEVELWEMCDVIESAQDDIMDVYAYVETKTLSLDIDDDGTITLNEFLTSLRKDRIYANFLWSGVTTVPPQHYAALERVNALLGDAGKPAEGEEGAAAAAGAAVPYRALGIANVLRLWEDVLLHTHAVATTKVGIFLHSMEKIFGEAALDAMPPDGDDARSARQHVEEIYSYYAMGAEELDARLLWGVFAKYAASDDAELKIQVVCALVNADRGDAAETAAISKEEISDYLVKIKRTAESLANNTVDLLDTLDEGGDGKISCAEMKKRIFESPTYVQCLGALQLYSG